MLINIENIELSDVERNELQGWIDDEKNKMRPKAVEKRDTFIKSGIDFLKSKGYSDSKAEKAMKKFINKGDISLLPDDWELRCSDGKIYTVAEIKANFDYFEDLTFVDPLETHTNSREFRVKIFKNADGSIILYSFRHGGTTYYLKLADKVELISFDDFGDKHPKCISKIIDGDVGRKAKFNGLAEIVTSYCNARLDESNAFDAQQIIKNFCNNNASKKISFSECADICDGLLKSETNFSCSSVRYSGIPVKILCRSCPLSQKNEDDLPIIDLNDRIPDFSYKAPDVITRGESVTTPSTLNNLKFLLKNYGIECFYNEILKTQIIKFPTEEFTFHSDLEDLAADQMIRSLCSMNELPKDTIDNLVTIFAENPINPIMEWVESKKWDGLDRLDDLIDCITLTNSDHRDYAKQIITVWLIQCIAALDDARRTPNNLAISKYELCLVFVGKQGGHKTSFFKSLLPKHLDNYYKEGISLNLSDKDSKKNAISCWIGELGEIDSTFRKSDIAQLKAFFSNRFDDIRLPYAKLYAKFSRRTSFCGTVNEMEFLNDRTGNRRFLPLIVEKCDKDHKIDVQQLWAQILDMYLNGAVWWLNSKQDDLVTQFQEYHQTPSHISDLLHEKFDLEQSLYADRSDTIFCNPSKALQICGYDYPTKSDLSECRRIIESYNITKRKSRICGYDLLKRSYDVFG